MAHNRYGDSTMAPHPNCEVRDCQQTSIRYVTALQAVTIGWMLIECGGSCIAAARAHSLPLAVFGSDSLVELLSAGLVLLQFGRCTRVSALTAARIASGLLALLAGVVVVLAALRSSGLVDRFGSRALPDTDLAGRSSPCLERRGVRVLLNIRIRSFLGKRSCEASCLHRDQHQAIRSAVR